MSNKRPEKLAPPQVFYNEEQVKKYATSSRMADIQMKLCERALELLVLPDDKTCFLLDIGCGSGISGTVITNQEHHWVGVDISKAMLEIANDEDNEGDLILGDMGQGMPFKAGAFDGAVSISALQWLCNEDMTTHNYRKRLNTFFTSLYACLSRNARAVLQFYPENGKQIEIIKKQSEMAGFFGGVLVDYPNSKKAKKFYLVLTTGSAIKMPKSLNENENHHIKNIVERMQFKKKSKNIRPSRKTKEWIINKKDKARNQGKDVCPDSKYTGRRRKVKF